MKYEISFRDLNELDINGDCRVIPDFDEFEVHVQAITEDINGLVGIIDVATHGKYCLIVTTQDIDLPTLKLKLKPLLQQHFVYLRIVAIESL
jgi:hypothetical protein